MPKGLPSGEVRSHTLTSDDDSPYAVVSFNVPLVGWRDSETEVKYTFESIEEVGKLVERDSLLARICVPLFAVKKGWGGRGLTSVTIDLGPDCASVRMDFDDPCVRFGWYTGLVIAEVAKWYGQKVVQVNRCDKDALFR